MRAAMRSINRGVHWRSYLRSFRNFALTLSDVRKELHCWNCGQLGAAAWRWVIQVNDRVGTLLGLGVRDDEFLYRFVGSLRAIEDTPHIIPWREIVRCEGNLPLSIPDVDLSARKSAYRMEEHEQNLAAQDIFPIFVPLPNSRVKHDKEPVVPSRVVPNILIYHPLDERNLHRPKLVSVEVRKNPLTIGPGVVVLGIFLVVPLNKFQFLQKQVGTFCCGVLGVDVRQKETTVVPDLVILEVGCRNLVHEQQLKIKGRVYGNEGLVPVLPARGLDSVVFL